MSWRDAVERSVTTAQLSMALYVLESCVAWDKSIMKAVSCVEQKKKLCEECLCDPKLSTFPKVNTSRISSISNFSRFSKRRKCAIFLLFQIGRCAISTSFN